MGFLSSVFRLIRSIFGLAEGGTDRATNSLLTSSPDMIRNQFQKTRNDWTKDYNSLKEAIAELQVLLNANKAELMSLVAETNKLNDLMIGSIEQYKKTHDEQLKVGYANFAAKKEEKEKLIEEIEAKIVEDTGLIESYTAKLTELKDSIDKLKEEEARTIADITSSKKIQAINERLQGLSLDTQSRNLDAIREEAKKVKAMSQIDIKTSGADDLKAEKQLLNAAKSSKFFDEFNKATALDAIFIDETPKTLPVANQDKSRQADPLDQLFK